MTIEANGTKYRTVDLSDTPYRGTLMQYGRDAEGKKGPRERRGKHKGNAKRGPSILRSNLSAGTTKFAPRAMNEDHVLLILSKQRTRAKVNKPNRDARAPKIVQVVSRAERDIALQRNIHVEYANT